MCRFFRLALFVVLAAPLASCDLDGLFAEEEIILQFGALADVQYCNCPYTPDEGPDYDFRASLPKLGRAIHALNAAYDEGSLAFSIHLGDLVDRDPASFGPVLAEWAAFTHPAFHVPGNHDIGAFGDYDRAVMALGIESPTGRGYYAFAVERAPGWRFLVLDGNDASLSVGRQSEEYARGEMLFELVQARGEATSRWNGGVSAAQMAWMEDELREAQAAGERVVVFSHFPLSGVDGFNLWNGEAVLAVMERYEHVAGFFGGHLHYPYSVSGSETSRAVPQVGVPSLLGPPDRGEWGIASIYADGHIAWEGQHERVEAWPGEPPARHIWEWVVGLFGPVPLR